MQKPRVRSHKPNGRPRKDTPDTLALLMACLTEGMTRRGACRLAGITEQTFNNWLHEGNGFLEAVEKCEAQFERDMLAGIRKEPKGKMWLLERRLRDPWQPPKQTVEVDQRKPLTVRYIDYREGIAASEAEAGPEGDSPAPGEAEVAGGGAEVG
jgi:hypothetical protein